MTPKEKAIIIVDKFKNINKEKNKCQNPIFYITDKAAKECALIAVDLLLQPFLIDYEIREHYLEVKQEIEKL